MILSRGGLEDFGMEEGDAIDSVAADDGKVGHVDGLLAMLLDERHAGTTLNLTRVHRRHEVKMAAIDLVDNHEMARKDTLEQRHRPATRDHS